MVLKERIESKKTFFENKKRNTFFECLLFFCLGFFLSAGNVTKNLQPFGISIISVSKNKNIIFSFIGAFLGYILGGVDVSFARYLAGAVMALIGATAASAFELNERPAFPMAVAFLSDFASGFVTAFRLQSVYTEYILTLAEAILCMAGAFFFFKSLNSSYKRIRLRALPFYDLACIMISFSLLLMNLSTFSIAGICPARIIAIAVLLSLLRLNNPKIGMIFALSFGFSFSIAEKGALFIVGAFAFSFLIAAMFFDISSLASSTGFLCSMSFFCIACESTLAMPVFIESLIGGLIFILLPSKINEKIENLSEGTKPNDSSLRQSLVLKLRFASSAMAAISESVEQVREKINEITRKENEINRLNISEEEYIRREIVLEKTN